MVPGKMCLSPSLQLSDGSSHKTARRTGFLDDAQSRLSVRSWWNWKTLPFFPESLELSMQTVESLLITEALQPAHSLPRDVFIERPHLVCRGKLLAG